jgi:fibronectin-binding autotransporter adhesin
MRNAFSRWRRRSAGSLAALLCLVGQASAATYYWDTDGSTAGFGTASGTWGTDPFWSLSTTGTVTPTVINPTTGDALNFGYYATGLAAGTINVGSASAGSLTFASGSGAIVLAGGTINLAPAATITVNNASNSSSSVLSGAGTSLTKLGAGEFVLNGTTASTYTGATNVTGRLTLDFSNMTTATNMISSGSALTLNNGTLSVIGKATSNTTQSVASTTLNSGLAGILQTQTGTFTTTVNLGAITRNVGAIFDISAPSTTIITNATSVNGNSLPTSGNVAYLGGWAVYGTGASTRFLQINSSGKLIAGPSGSAPGADAVDMTNPALVYTVSGTYSPVNDTAAFGLNLNAATTINLATGRTLTVSGMIQTNGTTSTTSINGPGSVVIGAERELTIHITGSNPVTFGAAIANNAGGASNFTVGTQVNNNATGAVILNAVNTYTGLTTVNGAQLTLGIAGAVNSSSGIIVNGGTLATSTFNQSFNSLKLTGGTITGTTGTISSTAGFDLQAGTISAILGGSSSVVKSTGGNVLLSGNNTYSGGFTLNEGLVRIHNDSTASTGNALGTGTVTLAGGVLTSSAGTGSTVARIANATNITGNVQLGSSDSLRAFTFIGGVTLANNPTVNLAAISNTTTGGVVTISTVPLTLNSNATLNVNQALTLTSGITASTSRILTINSGTTAVMLGGPLSLGSSSNSVTLAGSGTNVVMTLTTGTGGIGIDGLAVTSSAANTYNGATTITSGSLSLTGAGAIGGSTSVTLGSTGVLSVAGITPTSYSLAAAQPLTFVLDPTGLGSAGLLNAAGKTLNITNGQVNLSSLATLDDPVYILANYGTLTGSSFASVTGVPTGYSLNYAYAGGTQIALVAAVIPEPGLLALLGVAGVAGWGCFGRQRRRQSQA